MTDMEIKIREMEERIKKLEDVVFDQWLSQYGYGKPDLPTNYVGYVDVPNHENMHPECDFEHNYSWKQDYCGPFHGCNNDAFVKVNHD